MRLRLQYEVDQYLVVRIYLFTFYALWDRYPISLFLSFLLTFCLVKRHLTYTLPVKSAAAFLFDLLSC